MGCVCVPGGLGLCVLRGVDFAVFEDVCACEIWGRFFGGEDCCGRVWRRVVRGILVVVCMWSFRDFLRVWGVFVWGMPCACGGG
mgnify:CR=1 FL=1